MPQKTQWRNTSYLSTTLSPTKIHRGVLQYFKSLNTLFLATNSYLPIKLILFYSYYFMSQVLHSSESKQLFSYLFYSDVTTMVEDADFPEAL